jgi:16S rRNA processing protein RimM
MDRIEMGRVVGVHGLTGEVAVRTTGDDPQGLGRYKSLSWVRERGGEKLLSVESCRVHKGLALLKFTEIDSRNDAETLVGGRLELPRGDLLPAAEGRHYVVDLIGLEIVSTAGDSLGRVREVLETGANDVLVVDHDGREVLVPLVDHVVREIDTARGRIVIEVLDGLFD